MDRLKRFFECYVDITVCNLKCEYCYVRQFKRNTNEIGGFKYPAEHMAKALSKERLGGVCYFNICGGGETMLMPKLEEVVEALLKEGHWVSITTNGTYTQGFETMLQLLNSELCKHLHFAFSLHYLELKRKGWLERFAENVQRVKKVGCSYLVQLNLYDGYDGVIDEIKDYCISNFGAYPQIAATRLTEGKTTIELHTTKTKNEYWQTGKTFQSPLFDFTMQNFMQPRKEFCYAGDWSCLLDLTDGKLRKCYADRKVINVFENIDQKISFEAMGSHCYLRNKYCNNSSHFLSLGVIPELYHDITYTQLRNRPEAGWENAETQEFLSQKLEDNNPLYPWYRRVYINLKEPFRYWGDRVIAKIKRKLRK